MSFRGFYSVFLVLVAVLITGVQAEAILDETNNVNAAAWERVVPMIENAATFRQRQTRLRGASTWEETIPSVETMGGMKPLLKDVRQPHE